jgi:hypothetical protein
VKFYHFKRKAKEIQKQKLQANRVRAPKKKKKNKIVHDIVEIVENYSEKCAISSIRIDESNRKLIIEPETEVAGFSRVTLPIVSPHQQELPFETEYGNENPLNAVIIKHEPGLMIEENDESMMDLLPEDDDQDYSAGEASQLYYGGDSSEPSTSSGVQKRSRSQPNEGESKIFKLFSKNDFCID